MCACREREADDAGTPLPFLYLMQADRIVLDLISAVGVRCESSELEYEVSAMRLG